MIITKIVSLVEDNKFLKEMQKLSFIIASKKIPIELSYDGISYTNNALIHIGVPDFFTNSIYDEADLSIYIKGSVIHESAHIRNSNFDDFEEYIKKVYNKYYQDNKFKKYAYEFVFIGKIINNALEDGRIEIIESTRFPMNLKIIKYMRSILYRENGIYATEKSNEDKIKDLLMAIISISAINREPLNWDLVYWGTEEYSLLNNIIPLINQAVISPSHKVLGDFAFEILEILEDYILEKLQSNEDLSNSLSNSGNNNNSDISDILGQWKETNDLGIPENSNGSDFDITENNRDFYNNYKFDENIYKKLIKTEMQKNYNIKEEPPNYDSLENNYSLEFIRNYNYGDIQLRTYELTATSSIYKNEIYFFKKQLQDILDKKKSKIYKKKRNGLLDIRNSYRIELGSTNLFYKNKKGNEYNFCISILVDSSGSMNGSLIKIAHKTCVVLEEVLKDFVPLQIAFFSTADNSCIHHLIKDFDNNSKFGSYVNSYIPKAYGTNKDGLHIDYALNELQNRPEKNKFLIVLSDGLPSEYANIEEGISHVKKVVSEKRLKGIETICIAIGDNIEDIISSKKNYDMMYNNVIVSEGVNLYRDLTFLISKLF